MAMVYLFILGLALCFSVSNSLNIVLTNDDGFESELIQSLFFALEEAGHNVIMSAPYAKHNGIAGMIQFLQPLVATSEESPGGTLPAGSPVVGTTTLAENQFYVDGAVTSAVLYGVDILSPRYFDGQTPDLVVSGPNIGHNIGLLTSHSGAVAAAVTVINKGIPAMVFSASPHEENPELVVELAVELIESAYDSVPAGYGLNVNFPTMMRGTTADDYEFVMSKIGQNASAGLLFYEDLSACPIAAGLGINASLPGMCIATPITAAGYPEDSDPMSEYNVITSEEYTRSIAVSVIEGTYQGELSSEISLEEPLSDSVSALSLNIILTNDDGFETELIQSLFIALEEAGHKVVMSAPYDGRTATSSRVDFFQPLSPTTEGSPGGTLPAGSPAIGNTTLAENQFYVAGAVTSAVLYGVDILAPRFFDGQPPDLVVAGPNEGPNTGLTLPHSGTVGAAVTAINKGIPTVSFSCSEDEENPELIAELAVELIERAYYHDESSIPAGYGLNVNFPLTASGSTADDYEFVMAKVGLNALAGLLFFEELGECSPFARGQDIPFPGMCAAPLITDAGYPEDVDPISEFNMVEGNPFSISVTVIEGTFQADDPPEIILPSRPTATATSMPTTAAPSSSSRKQVSYDAPSNIMLWLIGDMVLMCYLICLT